MVDAAPTAPAPTAPAPTPRASTSVAWRIAALVVVAVVIVAVAIWQVGPAPKPADAGLPTQPPPLVLPSDVPDRSPLARAAALLAAGKLDRARSEFIDIVAEDQDGIPGQVGLVLTRWRSTGPISVERDLRQLVREYPDSALAALHLGVVQLLLQEPRAARESLRGALELGLDAGDPTSLRMARLADDLLHPDAFRGTMPVLVAPAEVAAGDRARVRELVAAATAGDRRRVARLAAGLARSDDDMTRLAVIAATFDKGAPMETVDKLSASAQAADVDASVRDRARFLATLAALWGGDDRDAGCTRLATSTASRIDAATRRLAGPIHRELCRR